MKMSSEHRAFGRGWFFIESYRRHSTAARRPCRVRNDHVLGLYNVAGRLTR